MIITNIDLYLNSEGNAFSFIINRDCGRRVDPRLDELPSTLLQATAIDCRTHQKVLDILKIIELDKQLCATVHLFHGRHEKCMSKHKKNLFHVHSIQQMSAFVEKALRQKNKPSKNPCAIL